MFKTFPDPSTEKSLHLLPALHSILKLSPFWLKQGWTVQRLRQLLSRYTTLVMYTGTGYPWLALQI